MKDLAARFHRATRGLTAKERACIVLESWIAGEKKDPDWLNVPGEQIDALSYYIGKLNGVNRNLHAASLVHSEQVEQERLRATVLNVLEVWGAAALKTLQFARHDPGPGAERWIQGPLFGFAPIRLAFESAGVRMEDEHGSPVGTPNELDRIATRLRIDLRVRIQALWQILRAFEEVLKDVAQEFDGEDPAVPELRTTLTESRKRLVMLRKELDHVVPEIELAEPPDEAVSTLQALVDRAVPEDLLEGGHRRRP